VKANESAKVYLLEPRISMDNPQTAQEAQKQQVLEKEGRRQE